MPMTDTSNQPMDSPTSSSNGSNGHSKEPESQSSSSNRRSQRRRTVPLSYMPFALLRGDLSLALEHSIDDAKQFVDDDDPRREEPPGGVSYGNNQREQESYARRPSVTGDHKQTRVHHIEDQSNAILLVGDRSTSRLVQALHTCQSSGGDRQKYEHRSVRCLSVVTHRLRAKTIELEPERSQ